MQVLTVNLCVLCRYHLKQRFPCDECGQTFSTESYMYKHRRTHSGQAGQEVTPVEHVLSRLSCLCLSDISVMLECH